jgi:hypothetical protein
MWQCASMTRCGCVVTISVLSEGRPRLRDAGVPFLLGPEALRGHERRAVDQPPLMPAQRYPTHEEWEARIAQARATFGKD